MSDESIFTQHNALLKRLEPELRKEGDEVTLGKGRGITIGHYEITDTALAACLATLDIPFREPAPFTEDVGLDGKGNEMRKRRIIWWMGGVSRQAGPDAHLTEQIAGAWKERQRFEHEHPLHPLVAMRAALDARAYWYSVIHHHHGASALLPIEYRWREGMPAAYDTNNIISAAILKAHHFQPVAFNGRQFSLHREKDGVRAEQLLAEAAGPGENAPQWMLRVLMNYSHLIEIVKKKSSLILNQDFGGGQTLLLSVDATKKVVDQFHDLVS